MDYSVTIFVGNFLLKYSLREHKLIVTTFDDFGWLSVMICVNRDHRSRAFEISMKMKENYSRNHCLLEIIKNGRTFIRTFVISVATPGPSKRPTTGLFSPFLVPARNTMVWGFQAGTDLKGIRQKRSKISKEFVKSVAKFENNSSKASENLKIIRQKRHKIWK